MNSKFLRLNSKDFARGLVVAVLAAIFASLAQAFNASGFDFSTFNWGQVLDVAVVSGLSYLAKNLLSDASGKVLGAI